MNYLSQTYLYPSDFKMLLYASQLLQAEAIRYGVEHWRRNRGACMGAVYWQLNDIWPVASWSSIDYYGRWKALHYFAKRFFAPIMISCEEIGETTNRPAVVMRPSEIETSARLNIANETFEDIEGTVHWELRDHSSKVLQQGCERIAVPALSSHWLEKIDFAQTDFLQNYLSFSFEKDHKVVSEGTVLFTAPKHFCFLDPELSYTIEKNLIKIKASNYAKNVWISSPDSDLILSDNFFDMNAGEKTIQILSGKPEALELHSVYNIK